MRKIIAISSFLFLFELSRTTNIRYEGNATARELDFLYNLPADLVKKGNWTTAEAYLSCVLNYYTLSPELKSPFEIHCTAAKRRKGQSWHPIRLETERLRSNNDLYTDLLYCSCSTRSVRPSPETSNVTLFEKEFYLAQKRSGYKYFQIEPVVEGVDAGYSRIFNYLVFDSDLVKTIREVLQEPISEVERRKIWEFRGHTALIIDPNRAEKIAYIIMGLPYVVNLSFEP